MYRGRGLTLQLQEWIFLFCSDPGLGHNNGDTEDTLGGRDRIRCTMVTCLMQLNMAKQEGEKLITDACSGR